MLHDLALHVAGPARWATHSPYSDPGRHAGLLTAVSPDPSAIHLAATNLILHYRSRFDALSQEQRDDIDARWLEVLLDRDLERHRAPLTVPRPEATRLAGCCRDHTLFAVGVLRAHGVPARSRVGFAGYLVDGFRVDHVVAERWDGDARVRFDPALPADGWAFDPHAIPTGEGAPFETAAEAWRAHRAGRTDLSAYGVGPGIPVGGPTFVRDYVVGEAAHRLGRELLLWDLWGGMAPQVHGESGEPPVEADEEMLAVVDHLAEVLVRADAEAAEPGGFGPAEDELVAFVAANPLVDPGTAVATADPLERCGLTDLRLRRTRWFTR